MPDGDKFERWLPSKIWRQAYRLTCRNEDYDDLVRLVRNAVEQDLRTGLGCPSLEEMVNLLHKALRNPLFASFDSIDREYELAQQLDAIAASDISYPGTRLAIEAAKSIYADNASCQQTPSIEQLREQLSARYKARIIDSQFLSRAREGIQRQTGRNSQEQVDREKQLIESACSYKRTPRQIQSQPAWDINRLNQPMPVMEA